MWRRPLEWNLNGTTDPRDGSVDHLSLNSLKDRHGPIRAPKSSPSSVSATLVKIAFLAQLAIALGLEYSFVPGATPKNPASGLIARSTPCASSLIHAMSSPTVVTFQPSSSFGGTSMARLVLPQALGNAAPK